MNKSRTQTESSKHQRSISSEARISKDSKIQALQKWRFEKDSLIEQKKVSRDIIKEKADSFSVSISKPTSPAFVIEINEEGDSAPALERQVSFIPVSSPVHSIVLGSMQLPSLPEVKVNLGGESLVKNSDAEDFN